MTLNKRIPANHFQTPDLALCAALCCFGYQIERIEKNGQRAFFSIIKDEKIDELINKFWGHQLKIDPLKYFNSTKEIKARIFNE